MFFDDILIYSSSPVEHKEHLQQVLSTLVTYSLYVNLMNCEFGKTMIEYPGHVISKKVVEMDSDKVRSMLEWPLPKKLRELSDFAGLTRNYRKFVSRYEHIARTLTNQLWKNDFNCIGATTKAFESLKVALTKPPVLALRNFQKSFIIETDAFGYGVRRCSCKICVPL